MRMPGRTWSYLRQVNPGQGILCNPHVYLKLRYVVQIGSVSAHADAIGPVLGLTEAETDSLTKANKTALEKIFKALAASKPL